MNLKEHPLYCVYEYDNLEVKKSLNATLSSSPTLSTVDLFDARIFIRDQLGRRDLPASLGRGSEYVTFPTFTYGSDDYARAAKPEVFTDEALCDASNVRGWLLVPYTPTTTLLQTIQTPAAKRYEINPTLLRAIRNAAGISQRAAAVAAGFTDKNAAQRWHPYERGDKTHVTPYILEMLANPFNLHPRQLLADFWNVPDLREGMPENFASAFKPIARNTRLDAPTFRAAFGWNNITDDGQLP